jgi:carboxyl-terminal processing protease
MGSSFSHDPRMRTCFVAFTVEQRGRIMPRYVSVIGVALVSVLSIAQVVPAFDSMAVAQPAAALREPAAPQPGNAKVLDEVWLRVRQSFYDPQLSGLDWDAIGARYRKEAVRPGSDLSSVINRMLGELGVSHTGYYTPEETAYYDLADIFSRSLSGELAKHFHKGEVAYVGLGIATRLLGSRHFVSGVFAGFPAAAAGLMVGDEIISVDGVAFEPVRSFTGKAERSVTLKVRRRAHAEPFEVTVRPQQLRPNRTYRDAMANSARIIDAGGHRIGYVHIWSYARSEYQQLLEELLTEGILKDADSFIWDLRDGWGGADPSYLDIFNARSPTMTLTDRGGGSDIVNGRWRKPVVLLINAGTRSGKEVLAYGFKKYGMGEVVGTQSAGALLAGRAWLLSNGGLLLLAVADVRVDGERLEGSGVAPTMNVPFDIRYAEGADPQLDRAIDLLTRNVSD